MLQGQGRTPYFQLSQAETILLAIVGKDLFPDSPTPVPFCKRTWKEQCKPTCSGLYVLESLGVDIDAAMKCYANPDELFAALREGGIVFLNTSYKFLGKEKKIRKKEHLEILRRDYSVNEPFLRRAKYVVLCGEAEKICWLPEAFAKGLPIVHPDKRNQRFESWREHWAPGALARRFQLCLHDIYIYSCNGSQSAAHRCSMRPEICDPNACALRSGAGTAGADLPGGAGEPS